MPSRSLRPVLSRRIRGHRDRLRTSTWTSLRGAGLLLVAWLATGCGDEQTASPLPPTPDPTGPYRQGAAAPQALTEVAAASVGGRIYLLGGLGAGGVSHRVEIYDPVADAWSPGPALPSDAPTHHLAVAVWQEQIYVLGGYTDLGFAPSARALRLDLSSGVWTRLRDQPVARGAATAQTLGARIHVVGGATQTQAMAAHWSYDPLADTWQARADMPIAREHLASCVDGMRMLVVGGRAQNNLRAAQIYDADRDLWTAAADLPTARGGLAAATLNRRCYVVGGEALDRGPPNTFAENEAFDFAGGAWTAVAPLPTPRHGLAAVALGSSLYTLLGGPEAGLTLSARVEIFTP